MQRSKFLCYFYFQQWHFIQLGFHIDLVARNIEIHVPFGFFRIGWLAKFPRKYYKKSRAFGIR